MNCERVSFPGGGTAIVCFSGPRRRPAPCKVCGADSTRLCDGPPPTGVRRTTCSAPICDAHATSAGPELDLCPACAAPDETGEVPSLRVFTARISSRDPDRFDITRQSGGEEGLVFAPSWALLRPALDARDRAKVATERAYALTAARLRREPTAEEDAERHADFAEAERIAAGAWATYVPAYRLEMLASWKRHRAAWQALLTRSRVVLVCYCTEPERCHRRLLAGYLAKLGAVDGGEIVEETRQAELFPGATTDR